MAAIRLNLVEGGGYYKQRSSELYAMVIWEACYLRRAARGEIDGRRIAVQRGGTMGARYVGTASSPHCRRRG